MSDFPHLVKDKSCYAYSNRTAGEYKRLAGLNAPRWQIIKAYEDLMQGQRDSVSNMVSAYLASPRFNSLQPRTQENYIAAGAVVRYSFGEMLPDEVSPMLVQRFVDDLSDKPHKAKLCKAFLSVVYSWGIPRGYASITNPCENVEVRLPRSCAKYIEDRDYYAFFNFLIDRRHPMHAAAMEIAYCCGARQQDVLRLRRHRPDKPNPDDCYITTEGIVIYQHKTGKVQLKMWSERLRAAVGLGASQGEFLLQGRNGQPYSRNGFNGTWQRRQRDALSHGVIQDRFRFHDLKHKAISDFEGDYQQFSGHVSKSMANRYRHKPERVKAL